MKKVISIVLICSLLFLNGCNNNNASNALKNAETYGYYSIANITYGMTFEDCCKAMGKTEKDFKLKVKDNEASEKEKIKMYSTDIKLYEKDATLTLSFDNSAILAKYKIGLTRFYIRFKDKTSYEFYITELKKELQKKHISYAQNGERDVVEFYNQNTVNSIQDKKIKAKVLKIASEWSPNKNTSMIGEYPLDSITLWPSDSSIDELDFIEFVGGLAAILNAAAR
ncbi:hypothetical protein RBG61_06835 [Paludicola sp. MB14-C6]|uniref:hypothetical protein n=1 Tax=Paludihabitans sp. MB14-C6 TaxID=3070656 RepID=UPI0027DC7940|nr:hypothetical protein [Paludicola sp. MB14-C6]WMJ24377.1 hypothetical protein RBG61_06835 [Paludicola sp. MB14-C6]